MVNIYKAKPKASLQGKVLPFTITDHDYEVHGISQQGNKIAFISAALPGEQVQARVSEDKAGFIKANTVNVVNASALRITPLCPYAASCGGCQLQHISPDNQRQLKQQGIDKLIRHQTGLNALPWQPMLVAQNSGYRRRARIGVWYDKKQRRLSVGFRQQGDKQIANVASCMVLAAPLQPIFSVLQQLVPTLADPTIITHAEVLLTDQQPVVILRHTKAFSTEQRLRFIAAWPEALWLGEAQSGQFDYWQEPKALSYRLSQGLQLEFAPDDFIQVNAAVNQLMVNQALDWLNPGPNDNVLELYAGMGNFSLALAQRAKTVHAIEGIAKMVQQLATNAKVNGLSNVVAQQADLHLAWPKADWNRPQYSKALLDPARAGAVGAVEQLCRLKPAQILYVSCNAATFARDAKVLLQQGYQLQKIGGADMFSYTSHLEVMALFSR